MNKLYSFILPTLTIIVIIIALIVDPSHPVMERINKNSTFILTVLTGVYVYLTYKILRSNEEIISEQTRPYIIITCPLNIHTRQIQFFLKNIGQRPAFDVKIELKPKIDTIVKNHDLKHLWKNYEEKLNQIFMPPNASIFSIIGYEDEFINEKEEKNTIEVSIKYFDSGNRFYSHKYKINLLSFLSEERDEGFLKDATESITKISKDISELKKHFLRQN
ncbi:MAG: hypothetical protein HGB11_14605 [Chlorobiales bacterium]|nr:hypothetical protein [Chlorobiales bacterium]